MNIGSVLDKFVSDALVEIGLLPDDNTDIIKKVTIIDGGVDKNNPHARLEIKSCQIWKNARIRIFTTGFYVSTLNAARVIFGTQAVTRVNLHMRILQGRCFARLIIQNAQKQGKNSKIDLSLYVCIGLNQTAIHKQNKQQIERI